ncbi:tetraacyldisaccharide 4'-kinase [Halomonas sp. MCCC 1A17488]|uniref:Tetraacyldisaccharide 4'-kinase n=1 Tax=Billgrantia sulfidoxydans TaxID=2733484 RepID=A0ABX7W3W9_9GAMM|nr:MULTISPECIES: tetraacyldisaccharide 4'-kinase [Halomonas]MCE8015677.1 tetraacyldisaccharide 4'-kinase [Halomonas sp. MCCC 1A17488]MCG3239010.1 tetraacyldisaccharide 4'-kinase [Halomonas sp. MCCC 1A17488]QPP51039.1 tetraacyldisaccharide 4'-kinase [Halomonas sp. SS10-MC5]QTP54551.1 tetraacyldisaccharide 4'-kinase [Halomonas sulfidoxydans]
MSRGLGERWLRAAYGDAAWLRALRPLEALYRWVQARRAAAYREGRRTAWQAGVPVIVVGNVTLGGTGKSPLVAWLARHLKASGWRPGIVSRGYGGKTGQGAGYPLRVTTQTPAARSGDEPRMLVRQTGMPVVVDPDRPRGVRALLEQGCDIVLSDDGLQHLALGRDIELVVVDGRRGFGNGRCLPAGPLREPLSRLNEVDAVLVNGEAAFAPPDGAYRFRLAPARWRALADDALFPLAPLPFRGPVHAVAGIGNPGRFFDTLADLGVEAKPHAFPDHHRFTAEDLAFDDDLPVVMTAKDAEKCDAMTLAQGWVLEVEAEPSADFVAWLDRRLAGLR